MEWPTVSCCRPVDPCDWRLTLIRDHGHAQGSRHSELTSYSGVNPGGTLGAAGLLVEPSLPDGRAAKSCIIAMAVMYPLMDDLSVEQEY